MDEVLEELSEKEVLYRPLSERELKRVVKLTNDGKALIDILATLIK